MKTRRGISTVLVAGIIVAVIAIAAIGAVYYYYFMPGAEPEQPVYPSTASSLKFNVEMTSNSTTDTYTYYLKNLDTDNITMREDSTISDQDYIMTIDEKQESVWLKMSVHWAS